ncbi:MAG: PadR family transcriptional regulator [Gemmatimonadetes bacterium]|nr:PadR family transcriptional regulator [Gemmatimonadota bacterium]
MEQSHNPKSHLPLQSHVFQILVSLLEDGLHGYSIIKDISRRTQGELELGTSTLYAAIKRMVQAGLLEETTKPDGVESADVRRRYYVATDLGRRVVQEEALRIRRLNQMVADTNLLEEKAR